MINIGKMNELIISSQNSTGYFLQDVDNTEEVFLPRINITIELVIDSTIEVFVYVDTKQRLIAALDMPYGLVEEYALLEVIDVQPFGAFFDWGISKDLLVPGNEQKVEVHLGELHIVRVCLEEGTDRIYGTTKLGKYILASQFDIKEGDKVSIQPSLKTDLGYRCIVNHKFIGMVYDNEIFTPIQIGQYCDAYVKKIRDDGLVDLALQAQGIKNLHEAKEKVLAYLNQNNGVSDLNDKSKPQEIQYALGMSKQTFKHAIGMLYKDRKIVISKDGIKIVKEDTA